MGASARAPKPPRAHAWARLGPRWATRTAKGPVLKPPRWACAGPRLATRLAPGGRQSLLQAKRGGSWLTNLPVRALVCSHAQPPWIGRTVFAPQGAERVRPAPHATRQGCAGTRRTGRRAWRRRGTRPSPSAPYPCDPRWAWTRARARAEAAFDRLRRTCAAPPPRLTRTGESSTRRQTFAEDGTRGRPSVEGAAANRHAALQASRSC
jgi:hypothetical protein